MSGCFSELQALVQGVASHHDVLALQQLSADLNKELKSVDKNVNFLITKPLKAWFSKVFAMNSEPNTIIYCLW